MTPPPFPFPHPSLLAAPRTPKAPLIVLDSVASAAVQKSFVCALYLLQLLSINIYRYYFFNVTSSMCILFIRGKIQIKEFMSKLATIQNLFIPLLSLLGC